MHPRLPRWRPSRWHLPCWSLLLLLPLLSGCGNTLWPRLAERFEPITTQPEDPPETLADATAEAAEQPALRLWIGKRRTRATLIQEVGERRIWRTAAGLVVATEGGRVTATAGLRQMLAATRFEGPDPLANPAALLDEPAEARRLVDLTGSDRAPEGMRFGVALRCRMRAAPTTDAAVLLVQESCRAAGNPGFTNRFWVEAEGGAVLRAEQWVGPRVPLLTLEFLSPAS